MLNFRGFYGILYVYDNEAIGTVPVDVVVTVLLTGGDIMDTVVQVGTIALGVFGGLLLKEGYDYLTNNGNANATDEKKEKKEKAAKQEKKEKKAKPAPAAAA